MVKQLKELLADAKAEYTKVTDAIPKFAAAATEVETKRTAVATQAEQVDGAQKRVADIRAELDGILVSVKKAQGEIDGLKQSAENAKVSVAQSDADIIKTRATVAANAEAVNTALAASTAAATKTKGLADISADIEQRVTEYESKLSELNTACDEQLKAITSLLPAATSTGLAWAFDQRRQTFLSPSKFWSRVFVTSVVILAVMALISLLRISFGTTPMSYQELLVHWLSRIPFAAALVWLAMHASRESALAKRLEEDYGFKASVASSFEGFQGQMRVVGGSAEGNEPLKTLCDATLEQITTPPGRIYEKHPLTVSPTVEFVRAANALVEALKAAKFPIDQNRLIGLPRCCAHFHRVATSMRSGYQTGSGICLRSAGSSRP